MATTNLSKPTSFDRTLASARSTMMFSEVVRLAVDSFRASKTRFMLTMLGMIIGSASVILVATLGSTGKQYALDQLTSLGPNKVASTETPPTKTPDAKPDPKPDSKPDVKPEGSPIIPEVINPATAKPVANSPQLQKQA